MRAVFFLFSLGLGLGVLFLIGSQTSANDRGLGAIRKSPSQNVACTFTCEQSGGCSFEIEIRDKQGVVVSSKLFDDVPDQGSRTLVYGGSSSLVSCDISDDGDDSSGNVRNPSWTVLDNRGVVAAMGANNDSSSSSDEDNNDGVLGPVWNSNGSTPQCMTKCEELPGSASYDACEFTIEMRNEDGEIVKKKKFSNVPPRGSRQLSYRGSVQRLFCTVEDHVGETEEDSAALIDKRGNVMAYMTATE